MNTKLSSATIQHILGITMIMLVLFVSLLILQWWVMAVGLLIITLINLFKAFSEPKEEQRTHRTGSFSDRVFNKKVGELIAFPVNIDGSNIVAVTYKDEAGIGADFPITIKPTTEAMSTTAK